MKHFAILMLATLMLAACATPKIVTVTEYRDRVQRDTLERVDSIYVSKFVTTKNDTVYYYDTIFKYNILKEAQNVYVHDSIPYEVEVVKEVRKRNGYDRFTSGGFWILIALILLRIAWWVFKKVYLRR